MIFHFTGPDGEREMVLISRDRAGVVRAVGTVRIVRDVEVDGVDCISILLFFAYIDVATDVVGLFSRSFIREPYCEGSIAQAALVRVGGKIFIDIEPVRSSVEFKNEIPVPQLPAFVALCPKDTHSFRPFEAVERRSKIIREVGREPFDPVISNGTVPAEGRIVAQLEEGVHLNAMLENAADDS